MKHNAKLWALSTSAAIVVALSVSVVVAWTGPTGVPPTNNVAAPINVGPVAQDKTGSAWFDGGLGVNAGSAICFGLSDCRTSWPAGGSSQWLNGAGGIIYYNGGNVGIGNTTPAYPLDVTGFINTDVLSGYKQDGNTVLFNSAPYHTLAVGASDAAGWMQSDSIDRLTVAIGSGALAAVPTNVNSILNTAVGNDSLRNHTSGDANTAVGVAAMKLNSDGYADTAVGKYALALNTTGNENTVVGAYADSGSVLFANSYVTVVGAFAGYHVGNGSDYNTLFGFSSGYNITSGVANVLIGPSSLASSQNQVTTGSGNISIGINVAVPTATASNQLDIGNLIYGTALDGTGATISSGKIGIGVKSPLDKLQVVGDIRVGTSGTNGCLKKFDGTGLIGACSSDARLKNVIGTVTNVLDGISHINLVNFHWNDTAASIYHNNTTTTATGFIAQDVQKQFPELVTTDEHGYYTLDYSTLGLYTTEAVKELSQKVDAQQREIDALKADIEVLKNK